MCFTYTDIPHYYTISLIVQRCASMKVNYESEVLCSAGITILPSAASLAYRAIMLPAMYAQL